MVEGVVVVPLGERIEVFDFLVRWPGGVIPDFGYDHGCGFVPAQSFSGALPPLQKVRRVLGASRFETSRLFRHGVGVGMGLVLCDSWAGAPSPELSELLFRKSSRWKFNFKIVKASSLCVGPQVSPAPDVASPSASRKRPAKDGGGGDNPSSSKKAKTTPAEDTAASRTQEYLKSMESEVAKFEEGVFDPMQTRELQQHARAWKESSTKQLKVARSLIKLGGEAGNFHAEIQKFSEKLSGLWTFMMALQRPAKSVALAKKSWDTVLQIARPSDKLVQSFVFQMIDVSLVQGLQDGLEDAMQLCRVEGVDEQHSLMLMRDPEQRSAGSNAALARVLAKLVAVQKTLDMGDKEPCLLLCA